MKSEKTLEELAMEMCENAGGNWKAECVRRVWMERAAKTAGFLGVELSQPPPIFLMPGWNDTTCCLYTADEEERRVATGGIDDLPIFKELSRLYNEEHAGAD